MQKTIIKPVATAAAFYPEQPFPPRERETRPSAKNTTEEYAAKVRVVPQTIRAGYCRNGHYLGLKPLKLATGKLLWDAAEIDQLLSGGSV
jgi:hypothetical protein